jgi:hypothetical protein
MDRRAFIGLSGGTAASVAVGPLGRGAESAEIERAQRHLATAFRAIFSEPAEPGSPSALTVNVTSEFMEDYTAGSPWLGSGRGAEVAYTSKDGTAQMFGFTGGFIGQPETVYRIYPDPDPEKVPDADTMTGWSVQQLPLPPLAFGQGGQGPRTPRAVLIEGPQDRLIIYRTTAVVTCVLGADGTLGPPMTAVNKSTSDLLVSGQFGADTTYLPEIVTAMGNNGVITNPWRGLGLRDANSLSTLIQVDPDGPGRSIGAMTIKKIFPLRSMGHGQYVCIVQEGGGDVHALELQLDQTHAPQPLFRVTGQVLVGNSPNGCVMVLQTFAGVAEVYFFDLPGIRHLAVTYDANVAPRVGATRTGTMPDFHMPSYPAGSTWDLQWMWNNEAQRVETFFTIQEPAADGNGNLKAGPLVSELWTTTMRHDGVWLAPMIAEKGVSRIYPFKTAGEVTVAIEKPRTGFELWLRDADGDGDTDHIRLENENGEMIEAAGFRVGITLVSDNEPLHNVEIGIAATVSTGAVIRGRHGTIGLHRPWQATCDSTGTLWVTVLLEDRLSFPQLILTCPLFADRLVLDLNRKIEDFLSNVSGDQLMAARDPRRCTDEKADGCTVDEVQSGLDPNGGPGRVTDRERADQAANLVQKTLKAAPPEEKLNPSSGTIVVKSDIVFGWLPKGSDISLLRRTLKPELAPSWRLTRRDGKAHLEEVSFEQASASISAMNALYPVYEVGLFDFFSDAIDAIGDLAKSAYEGVCEVIDATCNGLVLAVTLFVDGVRWVYNAVLDTIDMIMDAIDFFLEYAGMVLGMAVGWLLEQLGFLFDWKAIKKRRDNLKILVQNGVRPAMTKLGDPLKGARSLAPKLDAVKVSVFTELNRIRSTPADRGAFIDGPAEDGPVTGLSFLRGLSLMPQLSWMIDKLESVLPRMGRDMPSMDIQGLEDLIAAFMGGLVGVSESLVGMLSDILTAIDEWVIKGKLFSSQALDPLLDLIVRLTGRILDGLKAILEAGGQALQLCWTFAEKILAWLDNTLALPAMFRGFYKGLTGNSPSALDIACLLAAIPEVAGNFATTTAQAWPAHGALAYAGMPGASVTPAAFTNQGVHGHFERAAMRLKPRTRPAYSAGGDPLPGRPVESPEGQAAIAFAALGCITSGMSMGLTAAAPKSKFADTWSDKVMLLNIAVSTCFFITELTVKDNSSQTVWIPAATGGLVAAVATIGGLAYTKSEKVMTRVKQLRGGVADDMVFYILMGAAVDLVMFVVAYSTGSEDEAVGQAITFLQACFSAVVRANRPFDVYTAGALGVAQGALSGVKVWLYADRPIKGTA